jgi:hypothetical protein
LTITNIYIYINIYTHPQFKIMKNRKSILKIPKNQIKLCNNESEKYEGEIPIEDCI